jgi:hypothetical protein
MKWGESEHRKQIIELNRLWEGLRGLSELAKQNGIDDILQDNGAKTLQQSILANFRILSPREGNDAVDEYGQEWEMKSANINKVQGFSTHHHLNEEILKKYRKVPWLFSLYRGIELQAIYVMHPSKLEPHFLRWEQKLPTQPDINNPKIPIKFVKDNGVCIYDAGHLLMSPADALLHHSPKP